MSPVNVGDMPLLVHFTDTHLYADAQQQLKGVNTWESLQAVLRLIESRHADADMAILGGDLAQHASDVTYQALARELQSFLLPFAYVPGNHDEPESMRKSLGVQPESYKLGKWQLIFLNSCEAGEVGGRLSESELQLLDRYLRESARRHQLIIMHHHPVPIGSQWMDKISLANSGDFWGVVERHANVRGVLFGHVHQLFDAMRGPVRLLGSPSTCVQFKPGMDHFMLDELSPGYRWLQMLPDGTIETGVERVAGFLPADLSDTTAY